MGPDLPGKINSMFRPAGGAVDEVVSTLSFSERCVMTRDAAAEPFHLRRLPDAMPPVHL